MLARLALVALGLALVDAYSPGGASLGVRSLRSRRTTTVTNDLSILGAEDAESACVMLPHTPFDGSAPSLVCGEVNLQELEDDTDSITQLFLNADGTITHGVTEAPPPVAVCGLWQCGTKQFQMTLTRSFTNPGMTLPTGYDKSWKLKDYTYSVTRIFMGNVNPNAFNPEEALGGVNIVEGRMELYDERVYTGGKMYTIPIGTQNEHNDERSPYSGEVLTSFQLEAPIGWFSIDKVTAAEEGGDHAPKSQAGTYGGGGGGGGGGAPLAHQIEVHTGAGKGFGGGEATRNPEATVLDLNDPKAKQGAIHKAESFAEYLARRAA
jgi:hypothetical protein